ncbi:MAG: alpha/beta hydrolase [Oscillatoriales cyanobacterium]|nr:MAG: alpha/beta hydrolase [Oscillatoriales cyanobacterium]
MALSIDRAGSLGRSSVRWILKAGSVTLGTGLALALAAGNALALDKLVLRLPALGNVDITMAELKTFAETGQASGDFNSLLNDPNVAKQISRADLQKILKTPFQVGSAAARTVPVVVKSCPGELVIGSVSQVLYADNGQGNPQTLTRAIESSINQAASKPVTALDVLTKLEPKIMTVDVGEALKIFTRVKAKVQPIVDKVGNLTVREITSMDSAKLSQLLSSAGITQSDISKIQGAIQAFGTIDPGSDLDKLLRQVNVGSLLQKAASGNFSGILAELGSIDLGQIDLKPYEGRVSGFMAAMMEVLGLPVNKGSACRAVM